MIFSIHSILMLIKGIIFSPVRKINEIKEKKVSYYDIYTIFITISIFLFIKSLLKKNENNFKVEIFNNEFLNKIIELLSNPFIYVLVLYLLYFIVILYLYIACKYLTKKRNIDNLISMLLAISVLGWIAQPTYILLKYLSMYTTLKVISVIFVCWNWILIFVSIKKATSLSIKKILIIIIIPFIVIGISPLGPWSFMSPYLVFIQ